MRRLLSLVICGAMAAPAAAQVGGLMPTTFGRSSATAAPVTLQPEQLQAFDPMAVKLVWNNRQWLLVSDTEVIKDFGQHEQEARQALHVIQELGLTHHAVIGSPQPVMEYWLANGAAPQGLPRAGLHPTPLTPATLEVAQVQGQWCLRDKGRILFNFGARQEDANQALAVIRNYKFDQIGVLGRVTPSMYVFMSRSAPDGAAMMPATRGPGSGRVLDTPRFSRLAKNQDGTPRTKMQATPPATNLSLEGVAAPVVPPMANHTKDRPGDQPKPFAWQSKPGFDKAIVTQTGDRVPFDWRRANLVQEQGEWHLKSGGFVLANFGQSAHEARQALAALRHYRFTEQVRLGGDQPYLTYYVAGGATPRGVMLGVPAEEFKPDQLELKQMGNAYALCQGPRVILKLREKQDDGKKLLETIQRNKCDRICRIGEPGKEPMTLLVRSR